MFHVKHPKSEIKTVSRETRKSKERKMCKIIAVVNQKGGVGKTTTAVNLTAALHEMGVRVLLCDFDPQANATSGRVMPILPNKCWN